MVYFVDQDGDGDVIGPGIHAEALDGIALFRALECALYKAALVGGEDDVITDRVQEAIQDHLPALMNLAFTEGAKKRTGQ